MIDSELAEKLDELTDKVDAIQKTVRSMRRYQMWSAIVMVALIILPAVGLAFIIPQFLNSYGANISPDTLKALGL